MKKFFSRNQDDLRDQMIVSMSAIEGRIHNLEQGYITPEHLFQPDQFGITLYDMIDELKELIKLVPKGLPNK